MSYTESLLLPSRGIIYNLPGFDGTVQVKAFTTKQYKSLLQGNSSEASLKQFLDGCLVDCPIKAKNLNQHDLLAILLKTRTMTLGNKLKQTIRCPECGNIEELDWDLNEISVKYLYAEQYPIPVTLPNSEKNIWIRFSTGRDEAQAKLEAKRRADTFKKSEKDFIETYKLVSVLDVDGKDIVSKADWYEALIPQDAIFIDEVLSELTDVFGVQLTRDECCSSCGFSHTTYIDIGADFFRPQHKPILGVTGKKGNLGGVVEKSDVSE